MPRNICSGQRIHNPKYLESKQLRREMTPAEKRLWERLRKNRVGSYHFRRHQIIAGFIVDFYCYKANLLVEVDGAVHLKNKEADLERDAILKAMGFRILRFWNDQVMGDTDAVVEEILKSCGSDLTPSPP